MNRNLNSGTEEKLVNGLRRMDQLARVFPPSPNSDFNSFTLLDRRSPDSAGGFIRQTESFSIHRTDPSLSFGSRLPVSSVFSACTCRKGGLTVGHKSV